MYACYKLKASDLDASFLETPANRERLLKAIENVTRSLNLVTVDASNLSS